MGYIFDAWLEEGAPRLRVINPNNGATSLSWDCPTLDIDDDAIYRRELQKLFKQLLLLASAQDTYRENITTANQPQQQRTPKYAY